jgi:hypothetical protein
MLRYFKECSIVRVSFFVTQLPRLLPIGRCLLSLPQHVVLLFDGNLDGSRPVSAAAYVIAPSDINVVFACLQIAVFAVVVSANWVKTM